MARKKKVSVSEIADKLTKRMGKYEKEMEKGDKLSRSTAKLMHEKTQKKLDQLFEHQERLKQAEFQQAQNTFMKKYGGMIMAQGGYAPQGMRMYNNGGAIPPGLSFDDWKAEHFKVFPGDVDFPELNDPQYLQSLYGEYSTPKPKGQMIFPDKEGEDNSNLTGDAMGYQASGEPALGTEKQTITSNLRGPAIVTKENIPPDPNSGTDLTARQEYNNRIGGGDEFGNTEGGFDYDSLPYANNQDTANANSQNNNLDTSWQNMLYKGAAYAPTAYNLVRGLQKPQVLDQEEFQNPYEQQSMDLMRGRRYNVDPQLEAIKRNRAAAQRNIASASGGNAATYLGNIGAAQSRTDAANAQTYATKQNMDNQYLGQEAGMLGQFGAQRARTNLGIQDINDRNKAARDAHLGQAFTGVSQIAQNERLMNNQANADAMRIKAMQEMGMYFDPQFSRQGRRHDFQGYQYKGE
jgi:hypothetical protein